MELVYNYHYTFEDVFYPTLEPFKKGTKTLNDVATLYGISVDDANATILKSAEVTKLFIDYVLPTALDKDFCITDAESDTAATNPDIRQALNRFIAYLLESYPYYSKVISLYDEKATDLLAQVTDTTTSKTGNSDMPQTATFDNAPTSDVLSMLENVTATTKQDYGTTMQRLDEVRKMYSNLYREWADEVLKEFVLY
jgi:hypothetical protein